MDNVEIKEEKKVTKKKVSKKVAKKNEDKLNATQKMMMHLNEMKVKAGVPMAYSAEEIAKAK